MGCGGRGGGFSTRDADHAEDGQFAEGGARNEDAVGGGIEVRRGDLDAVVEQGEKVVGDDAFDGFAVEVAEADPKAVELGAAEEGFAFGFEVVGELADEINGANAEERNFLMLTIGSEEIDGIGLAETGGVQIAAKRRFVGKDNDDLLVSRGWGAVFQRNQSVKTRNG